jgi:crotonobetainyl-CoA:carnitine CoA-transferase CaiB-like acyl-CoA transferase
MTMTSGLPFSGLRVLDLGTVIAGPFAGSLMADLGAEVIKIEPPAAPDALRKMGRTKDGVALWWGVSARAKQCMTLNLKAQAGQALFKQLARRTDVIIENYRPGVLDRLGLGWEALHALNPGLILLSISGFGQTGPYAARPGFGKVAEGFSGAVNLTGRPDEKPLYVGFSLADACTGLFGAFGVALALYQRDLQGGGGSQIDLALYEPLLRMLDAQFIRARTDQLPSRRGTSDPYGWGRDTPDSAQYHGVRCTDGTWLLIRIPDPEAAARLTGHASPDRAAVSAYLADFAATRAKDVVAEVMLQAGAAVMPVFDGLSAAADPYFRARGDVVAVDHSEAGRFFVPAPIHSPVSDDTHRRFHAPGVGEHTDGVLRDLLGLEQAHIDGLRGAGVI